MKQWMAVMHNFSLWSNKTLCCFNALQVCQNTKRNVALVALFQLLAGKSSLLLEKLHCFKSIWATVKIQINVVKLVASLLVVSYSMHILYEGLWCYCQGLWWCKNIQYCSNVQQNTLELTQTYIQLKCFLRGSCKNTLFDIKKHIYTQYNIYIYTVYHTHNLYIS